MEVSTIRLYRGYSYEVKPREDSGGVPILPESIYEESDTGLRYRWTGTEWRQHRIPGDVMIEKFDELLTVQRKALQATLLALSKVAEGEEFTPDEVLAQVEEI